MTPPVKTVKGKVVISLEVGMNRSCATDAFVIRIRIVSMQKTGRTGR